MFEHRRAPLASRKVFARRLLLYAAIAAGFAAVSVAVGGLAYMLFEGQPWLQAFLNAAMILTGNGPQNEIRTDAGKVFTIVYALYGGVAFLSVAAVLMVPVVHRFMHRFHLELKDKNP
jgi:hypothetical protein